MKRIFIAIKIVAGKELSEMISSFRSGFSENDIKWTHTDNIHVTLAFLGDTDEKLIEDISAMLSRVCVQHKPFRLLLKGAGLFRSISDPRIIWAGVEPSDELSSLNSAIIAGLKKLNIRLENRPFNPHLTIGRIKHLPDPPVLQSLITGYRNIVLQKVDVKEVILFESLLLRTGPVYKPVSSFPLETKC